MTSGEATSRLRKIHSLVSYGWGHIRRCMRDGVEARISSWCLKLNVLTPQPVDRKMKSSQPRMGSELCCWHFCVLQKVPSFSSPRFSHLQNVEQKHVALRAGFPKCPKFTEKASHNQDDLMPCDSHVGPKTVRGLHCLHSATLGKDSACSGCSSFRDSAHKALQLRGQEIRRQGNHPP